MKNFFQILPVMIVTNIVIFVFYMLAIQFVIGFILGFTLVLVGYEEADIIGLIEKINLPLVLVSLAVPVILAAVSQTRSKFYITKS